MKRFLKILAIASFLIVEAGTAFGIYMLGDFLYYEPFSDAQEEKYKRRVESYSQLVLNEPERALELAEKVYKTHVEFDDKYPWNTWYANEIYDVIETIFKVASENDIAEAQYYLGRYYKGWKVSDEIPITNGNIDNDKAAYWFLQSSLNGYLRAYGRLALCYRDGKGVEQNFIKCVEWLSKGANEGSGYAQYFLGCAYETGLAYKYDVSEGDYFWCSGIATRDWGTEETDLKKGDDIYYKKGGTNTYLNRNGLKWARWTKTETFLERDIEKARYYWELAADNGYDDAKDKLHHIYED